MKLMIFMGFRLDKEERMGKGSVVLHEQELKFAVKD